ncbi:hypothetical protein F4823DRAFT_347708 [Ustulina deusta]|nr:hypothetical protein F4823DRAFT_347708 [Ustulina deusta]
MAAAAAAVTAFVSIIATKSESGWLPTLPSPTQTPQWIELDLKTRLTLISRQWLLQRTHGRNHSSQLCCVVVHKPLTIPNPAPKRSRRLPLPCDTESSVLGDIVGSALADERAHRRVPSPSKAEGYPLPPSDSPQRRDRREDSLFGPSIPESYCDFSSEDGFVQHAKKSKRKPTQPLNSNPPPGKKDDSGAGDGGAGGGGEQNGGAGETGGDGAGKGDGDDKKDNNKDEKGGPSPDGDAWGTFATVGKKKKKDKAEETTDLLGTEPKFDAFDEIKLNDTRPSLDLDFGSSAINTKANAASTWGSSWNPGTTWDRSGTKTADKTEDKEENKHDLDSSPWSVDRPKPKKKGKTTFGFSSFDEGEDHKTEEHLIPEDKPEEKKDDDFGFGFATAGKKDKKKKKNGIWDPEPETHDPFAETLDTGSAAVDDGWGDWGATAGKSDKKGTTTWLDPTPQPDKTEPADDFWGAVGTKGTKKKKDIIEPDSPAHEPPKVDNWADVWGAAKKDQDKKKKKGVIEEVKEPNPPAPEAEDDFWGSVAGKKNGQGKNPEPAPAKENKPAEDELLGTLGTGSKKSSSKKKKKGAAEEKPSKKPEPDPIPELEPEPEPEPEPAPAPEPEPEPEPAVEEPSSAWSFWGATKKTLKKTIAEPTTVVDSGGDSWLNWGSKKKNGKIPD